MPEAMLTRCLLAIPMQGATGFMADSICQGLEIHGRNKAIRIQTEKKHGYKKSGKEFDEEDLEPKTYALRRSAIFASVGAFIIGPLSMLRYSLYDSFIPGNRIYVEVPIKTGIECLLVTPLMAAMGMSINEYMKPDSTLHSVGVRLKNEYWKVLVAGYVSKIVTTFFLMSFPGPQVKFLVGLCTGLVLNVFNSWRINVMLDAPPAKKDVQASKEPQANSEVEAGDESSNEKDAEAKKVE